MLVNILDYLKACLDKKQSSYTRIAQMNYMIKNYNVHQAVENIPRCSGFKQSFYQNMDKQVEIQETPEVLVGAVIDLCVSNILNST